jgi:hypothetical protein
VYKGHRPYVGLTMMLASLQIRPNKIAKVALRNKKNVFSAMKDEHECQGEI